MKERSSITALMSAFGRAFHAENTPNPIFDDHMARGLMTDEEYAAIGGYLLAGMDFLAPDQKGNFENEQDALRYLVHTQIAPTPLARARFCEDSLRIAALTGTQQYVILGAGMDTFAFRDPSFVQKHRVFEVDHPLTQADKLMRIRRAGWEIPENLRFVPADLSKDELRGALQSAGFDPSQKTFFSWLGVSYYLSEAEIAAMLESIAAIAAEGSSLIFDYADEGLFASPVRRVQNMLAMAAAGGEPMKSCFAYPALEKLLERQNFLIYEQLSPSEIQQRYFIRQSPELSAFEHIHYVNAVHP